MDASKNIIHQIRRSLLVEYVKALIFMGVIVSVVVWITDKREFLFMGLGLMVVGAFQVYLGRYIPLLNKHDSLRNKYGDVYVDEVDKAIGKFGVSKLISTRWFETYADEFCLRSTIGKPAG